MKSERGGCRFVVTKTDNGKPMIKMELFHDTVSHLRSLAVGFEMLSGVSLEHARCGSKVRHWRCRYIPFLLVVSPSCAPRLFSGALTNLVAEIRNFIGDVGSSFFTATRCD